MPLHTSRSFRVVSHCTRSGHRDAAKTPSRPSPEVPPIPPIAFAPLSRLPDKIAQREARACETISRETLC